MKMKKLLLLLIFIPMLTLAQTKQNLNGDWLFKQSNSEQWLPAIVPGQVHTDLFRNKQIENPFFGINEKKLQWIGEKDWEYKRTFTCDKAILQASNAELVMEGIDTYADVYINDVLATKCDNMFRTWRVNIKPYLKEGENTLYVRFTSVFKVDMPKYLDAPFKLQAWPNNDQNDVIWLSLYARKAGYNYGWDWGPRLITSGIWRDIYIEAWNDIKVDAAQVVTAQLSGKQAYMESNCNLVSDGNKQAIVEIWNQGKLMASKEVSLIKGENLVEMSFNLKNPQLWWSNGLGKQPMYDFDFKVKADGKDLASKSIRTAVRTIEIVRDRDKDGQSMYVKLNGKNVFMKGANYIPLDNFPARVADKTYEHIIKSAADANMNMLRIWGGGIYEKDVFYDLCDKYGILVWQDMMFACGMFPADEDYLNNVTQEIKDNIKRLRNHPCIALWNGNNENEISYYGWGWKGTLSPEHQRIYEANLVKLFHQVIPAAILSQDKSRYYHPTSPNTGYNDIGMNMGDVHFWWVWKGGWVEEYLKPENIGRFMSEYGFQSYPEMSTIRKFTHEQDRYIDSEAVLSHQRAKNDNTRDPHFGNKMMMMYMNKYFNVPENFEHFVYVSQLLQGEAVKVAIEAHRRAMPYCMGTLFWQINDCWPAASWSSIDYYGKWKGLHYMSKHAYEEVIVSPYRKDGNINVKVVSDRQSSFVGKLEVAAMKLDGEVAYSKQVNVKQEANSVQDVFSLSEKELFQGAADYVYTKLSENGKVISTNLIYTKYANGYTYKNATPQMTYEKVSDGILLKIKSDYLIRGLYLYLNDEETSFSDNYFTVVPNEEKEVYVKTSLTVNEFKNALHYLTYNQIMTQGK